MKLENVRTAGRPVGLCVSHQHHNMSNTTQLKEKKQVLLFTHLFIHVDE